MDALWQDDQPHTGFGVDPYHPFAVSRPLTRVGGHISTELRNEIRECCPKVPGVYGMLDRRGQLIYVGKSKALRSRLLSYFSEANAEEKAGRIIQSTRVIQWETQPSEFAALLREQHLIRQWVPRWNVQEIPKRQRPVYLCLGRAPAAYFFLARVPPHDAVACQGPFHGAGRMTRALDALNKFFKLRDCSNQQTMRFAEQLSLFQLEHRPGCLRYEIGTCLGPCAAGCTRNDYDRHVLAAKQFLDGLSDEPLLALQRMLELASSRQQFELAARARDDLAALQYLHRKLLFLADARRKYTFVYSVPGFDGFTVWYLIRNGEVADVLQAPKCPETYAAARPQLRRWKQETETGEGASPGQRAHTLSLVAKWFKKNRDQLARTFPPAEAGRRYRSRKLRYAAAS